MKRYRLKKDLPTFKAGDEFELNDNGNLYMIDPHMACRICAYTNDTLKKFPDILKDWFDEILSTPMTVWDLKTDDEYYGISESGCIFRRKWDDGSYCMGTRKYGNAFLTQKDAEHELERRRAHAVLELDTKGFKITRDTFDYWQVFYDIFCKEFKAYRWFTDMKLCKLSSPILFATKEDAEASILVHPKEWKIYLGVEDV